MTILISIGKWGGIYLYHKHSIRICLGFVAITILPTDGDNILAAAANWITYQQDALSQANHP